jgi:hypothetical protein
MPERWDSYFQPGETLLWQGTPKQGVYSWPKIIALAAFGLPFLLAGLGALGGGLHQAIHSNGLSDIGLGLFLVSFSLVFVGVGAVMVFGQWWGASQAHLRVRYALTTRCAYIAQSYWTRKIESYPILPGSALGLEKGARADTVWFHVTVEKDMDGDRTTSRVSFDNIAEGDKVYALLRSIQSGQAE